MKNFSLSKKILAGLCLATFLVSPTLAYNNLPFKYSATDDATVYSGNPNKNYDGSNSDCYYLWAGTVNSTNGNYRSYLKFDFSAMNTRVNECILNLYAENKNSGYCYVDACKASNWTWSEGTITWNTQSSWTLTQEDQTKINNAGTMGALSWFEWDVTSAARWAQSNSNSILSLAMKGAAEGTSNLWAKFHSREHPGYNGQKFRPDIYIDSSYCTVDGTIYQELIANQRVTSSGASVNVTATDGYASPTASDSEGDYFTSLYVAGGCSGKTITAYASKTGFSGSYSWLANANNLEHGDVTMKLDAQANIDISTLIESISISNPGDQFSTSISTFTREGSDPVDVAGFTMTITYDPAVFMAVSAEPISPFDSVFDYFIDNQAGTMSIQASVEPGLFLPLPIEGEVPLVLCQTTWTLLDIPVPGELGCMQLENCTFQTIADSAQSMFHTSCHLLGEVPKYIDVISPNGGEEVFAGREQEITWDTSENVHTVLIEASDSDEIYHHITLMDSTGSYLWQIPEDFGGLYKIRITDADDVELSDTSDDYFTVYQCLLLTDTDGNCFIDLHDLRLMCLEWLNDGTFLP